jgi:uncharacterized protein (TIGR02145 family)
MNPVQILMMNQQKNEALSYGLLYNWYAISNANFATSGWHVPSYTEWTTLITYLGGSSVAGGKLKETGTVHWASPNTGATNESGFTGLPGGYRVNTFSSIGTNGNWWSTTEDTSTNANNASLFYSNSNASIFSNLKIYGFSIRLIKDTTTLSDGETSTMTDYDGNVYDTICIGTQEWIVQNWKCTHLNDGTSIPEVTDSTTWAGLSTGALCAYNNNWSYV